MTREEARQLALGYAWAAEDTSGTRTVTVQGAGIGSHEFSDAFAEGYDDYNSERRCNMVPVQDAYEHWQASGGQTVFRDGDSTAQQQARFAECRAALQRVT